MTVVEYANLIGTASTERSRLHRLTVNRRHYQAQRHAEDTASDARIYRCAGCGDWRYRADKSMCRGARTLCQTCGTR